MTRVAEFIRRIGSSVPFSRLPLIAVVGAPRSGSTLLLRLLDSHSRIAAPCEIGIPGVFPEGDEKYPLVVEKWRHISAYYGVEPERARADPFVLFRAILRREGKSVLVLKDPRASLYIAGLARYRPRFLHLIRDARAVASSRMFSDPATGFERWLSYHGSVLAFFAGAGRGRPLVMRYEDLVARPGHELRALLGALALEFENTMLDFSAFEHADDKLRLWGGKAPQESELQRDLGRSIRSGGGAPVWREDVLASYERLGRVKELNEAFGYR